LELSNEFFMECNHNNTLWKLALYARYEGGPEIWMKEPIWEHPIYYSDDRNNFIQSNSII